MTEPWVSAEVTTKPLGLTKDSVYAWIAKEEMPAHRVGRRGKFKVTDVDEWMHREDANDLARPSGMGGR